MQIVKLLVDHGANIHAITKNGINMLHVSAQGDQPVSLVYFLDKGLDINAQENRGVPQKIAELTDYINNLETENEQ